MGKLLVHKKDTVESVAVNGFLTIVGDEIIVQGEKGSTVNLIELIKDFDGEEIVFGLKKADKETIETIE